MYTDFRIKIDVRVKNVQECSLSELTCNLTVLQPVVTFQNLTNNIKMSLQISYDLDMKLTVKPTFRCLLFRFLVAHKGNMEI